MESWGKLTLLQKKIRSGKRRTEIKLPQGQTKFQEGTLYIPMRGKRANVKAPRVERYYYRRVRVN